MSDIGTQPGRPDSPEDDSVDEAGKESFPASDPPAAGPGDERDR